MDETVNLYESDTLVGSTTISGLPTERYPSDLGWLAPLVQTPDGRLWQFKSSPSYGPSPAQQYQLATVKSVPEITKAQDDGSTHNK
jgi:hypothetical protein